MENLRRSGYAQVVGVEPNPVAADIGPQEGLRRLHQLSDPRAGARRSSPSTASSTPCSCGMSWSMSATSMVSSPGSARCCGTMACWCSSCPRWRRASGSAARPSCGKSTSTISRRRWPNTCCSRFGFDICDRRSYVFGGGSMAFVARKRMHTPPVACAIKVPDPSSDNRTVAPIRRRHRAAEGRAEGLVSLARSTGFQVARLRRGAAFLPVGICLPDRRQ